MSDPKLVEQALNTDRELWRERPDDYYAPSIHVTAQGGIGINVGGNVKVMPLTDWHRLAALKPTQAEPVAYLYRREGKFDCIGFASAGQAARDGMTAQGYSETPLYPSPIQPEGKTYAQGIEDAAKALEDVATKCAIALTSSFYKHSAQVVRALKGEP